MLRHAVVAAPREIEVVRAPAPNAPGAPGNAAYAKVAVLPLLLVPLQRPAELAQLIVEQLRQARADGRGYG
jgi:hypothetical protein